MPRVLALDGPAVNEEPDSIYGAGPGAAAVVALAKNHPECDSTPGPRRGPPYSV